MDIWEEISEDGIASVIQGDGELLLEDCEYLREILLYDVPHMVEARGTNSQIYRSIDPRFVVKVGIMPTYASTYLDNEAIILAALSSLDLRYFPRFYAYFKCPARFGPDDETDELYPYLVMENLIGKTLTNTVTETGQLSLPDRKVILLQAVHALYVAGKAFQFNHYDLNGQNIILNINRAQARIRSFDVEDTHFSYNDLGVDIKIIGFDKSRLTIGRETVYDVQMSDKYYDGEPVPYHASADLCRLFGNPNLKADIDMYGMFDDCHYNERYTVVPPFPLISPRDVLLSPIFDEFRNKSQNSGLSEVTRRTSPYKNLFGINEDESVESQLTREIADNPDYLESAQEFFEDDPEVLRVLSRYDRP